MEFFNDMMTEVNYLKMDKKEWMAEMDMDIYNYIFKTIACKKGKHDDDESTLGSEKIVKELRNLHDFDALFGDLPKTPV